MHLFWHRGLSSRGFHIVLGTLASLSGMSAARGKATTVHHRYSALGGSLLQNSNEAGTSRRSDSDGVVHHTGPMSLDFRLAYGPQEGLINIRTPPVRHVSHARERLSGR
jgi:hypothetical protein